VTGVPLSICDWKGRPTTADGRRPGDGYVQDMAKQVTIEAGGKAGTQHRWSCLSCGTMGRGLIRPRQWLVGRSTETSTPQRTTKFTTAMGT
jgi:hypothetical protein